MIEIKTWIIGEFQIFLPSKYHLSEELSFCVQSLMEQLGRAGDPQWMMFLPTANVFT